MLEQEHHGQGYFHQFLNSIDGALAIAITDKEGVPVLLAKNAKTPPNILKILTTVSSSLEKSNRLGFGDTKYMISFFSNYQLVCFNNSLLFVTVVAEATSNTGQIINSYKDLSPIIQKMVQDMEQEQLS